MAAVQKVKHAKARALVNAHTQQFDFSVLKLLEWEQITFGDDRGRMFVSLLKILDS